MPKTQDEIAQWCVAYLARMLKRDITDIDVEAPFPRLGLDSAMAIYFVTDLEEWVGTELWPEFAFKYPTVKAVSSRLSRRDPGGADASS